MSKWKLVPVEPPPKMIEDMANAILSDIPVHEIYSVMLAAAPSPEWETMPAQQALATVNYIRYWLKQGATIRAETPDAEVLMLKEGGTIHGGLHIQMPAEWVKTSDRLPTREDADETGRLWCHNIGCVVLEDFYNASLYLSWMPKPRQQPPAPPAALEGDDD